MQNESAVMRIFIFLLFVLAVTSFTQDLPVGLTPAERELMKSYIPPFVSGVSAVPPSSPVRTMAEWEQLEGIMITWTSYTAMLRQIVDHAQEEGLVYIVCSDSNAVKSNLTSNGIPLTNVKFITAQYNSVWCRDYGPWYVYKNNADSAYIIDWIYNRPRPLDDLIPGVIAGRLNIPLYQMTVAPDNLVATGGNFMVDGNGTGFSSRLIINENPGKTEAQIDSLMKRYMGITRYIKFETLPYDGIHHIDMHMKLLDEETILVGQYPPGIADGPQIEMNLQYLLTNFRTCYGRPYKVVRIPMPPDGQGRYPSNNGDYRTYTNSVIVNKTVIVPTYELQYDTTGLRIYREAMPGYKIVGVNSNQSIPALGAIHCITKELGVKEPVFISHAPIRYADNGSTGYEVKAYIRSASGIAEAKVFWTTDTALGFQQIQMSAVQADSFLAIIPQQQAGKRVFYYISAVSLSGKYAVKPPVAPGGVYSFPVTDVLPVELVSFYGVQSSSSIVLKWVTVSEHNNRGFEVQKKYGNEQWVSLAMIPGNGTTTEVKSYEFTDIEPVQGINTYRIKQIDYDGSNSYSQVVMVHFIHYDFVLQQNFPNPFNPETTIKYTLPSAGEVVFVLHNLQGEIVFEKRLGNQQAGNHTYFFNSGGLSSGMYFYTVKFSNAGEWKSETKKLIILK